MVHGVERSPSFFGDGQNYALKFGCLVKPKNISSLMKLLFFVYEKSLTQPLNHTPLFSAAYKRCTIYD